MVCGQLEELPLASVAVQVRTIVFDPGHCPDVTESEWLIAGFGSQLSVAEAMPVLLGLVFPGHSSVTLPGQTIFGASLSVTVTVNEQLAVLPLASVAVYATVVVPTGNAEPEAGPAVRVTLTPGQLSLPAGAVQVTTAEHMPLSLDFVMLAGQEIVGA